MYDLKLILNLGKTKCMVFSNVIATLAGHTIEQVKVYKYLGVWFDDKLSFTVHVEHLIRKLKLKIGFYYRHKACFSFEARKELVRCTLLVVLDFSDVIYICRPQPLP